MMGFLSSHLGQRPNGLGGQETIPSTPIYSGEAHGSLTQSSGAALPLSQVLLLSRGAWRSPAGLPCSSITITPSCCCWSPVPQPLPPPCWIKARETSSLRTCVEHGGAVRLALVIGDLDHVEYDYIITLQASARDLQVVCRCKLSP